MVHIYPLQTGHVIWRMHSGLKLVLQQQSDCAHHNSRRRTLKFGVGFDHMTLYSQTEQLFKQLSPPVGNVPHFIEN